MARSTHGGSCISLLSILNTDSSCVLNHWIKNTERYFYSSAHLVDTGNELNAARCNAEYYLYPATPDYLQRVEVYDVLTRLHQLSDQLRWGVGDNFGSSTIGLMHVCIDMLESTVGNDRI